MNLWEKIKELGWKKVVAITILAATDVFIIAAPYYLKSLIPNIQNYLGVNEADMSSFTAVLGWVTLLTQLPGGWLTDKFSSRKLLIGAILITGIVTMWFGTLVLKSQELSIEDLRIQYFIIFALWGISSTPLFWSPLWKLVSQQTDKKNQSFAYGMQGSLNGIIGLVFVFLIGIVVTTVTSQKEAELNAPYKIPFSTYLYIFGFILFGLGFGIYFFVVEKTTTEKFSITPKELFKVMLDWKVWALSIFLLGMYMFQSTFAYFLNQMLINTLKLPGVWLIVIGGIRLYGLRFLISAWVGKLADKLRSLILLLLITLLVGFVFVAVFLFLPGISNNPNQNVFDIYSDGYKLFAKIIMVLIFFCTSILSWIMVTLRYAQAAEIYRPKNSYGAVTALMSFVGFSSDAWFYQIASAIQNNHAIANPNGTGTYTSQTGYQIVIGIGMIIAFIGLFAGFLVWYSAYKFNKQHGISYYRWRDLNN